MLPELEPGIQTFPVEQFILPCPPSERALGLLKKAENAGLGGMFKSYWFSGVILTQDTQALGWKNLRRWYWEQIANGNLRGDAVQLPNAELLIDITPRPNYEKGGKQLHENDPLGPLMAKLRKEGKLPSSRYIPETSRFWTSPKSGLTQFVLPEIARLLEEDASAVRLLRAIELNVLANTLHPDLININTLEWLDDELKDSHHLVSGSGFGGLSYVSALRSEFYDGYVAFRPVIVVPQEA